MTPLRLSRRTFLAATGGLVVAAACGRTENDQDAAEVGDAHAPIPQGEGLSALLLASDLYASPEPQRLVFALAKDGDYASGPPAVVALGPQGGTLGDEFEAELFAEGLPDGRGIYRVDAAFPEAGIWGGIVRSDGEEAELALTIRDQSQTLVPGQAAPRDPSPTVADPLGVDPLCTRDPECPLHDTSLDRLIGAGTPVAVMFATPARCQSQYCGPVLDEMLTLMPDYEGRIVFVHVEIYRADTGIDTVPTVEAWGLPSEPWLFGIDAGGTVISRLDGAFGGEETRRLLDELVV